MMAPFRRSEGEGRNCETARPAYTDVSILSGAMAVASAVSGQQHAICAAPQYWHCRSFDIATKVISFVQRGIAVKKGVAHELKFRGPRWRSGTVS
jgi:hypothetical protein